MPFAKMKKPLVLKPEELEKLEEIASSRTESHARVLRSKILLAYVKNRSISSIAREVGVSRPTVDRCVDKALAGGIETALTDLKGRGRNPTITAEAKTWVLNVACSKPTEYGYAAELWTLEQLAKHVRQTAPKQGFQELGRANKSTVHRILTESEIRPHKIKYYLERRDPLFEEKMAQVLYVYKQIEQHKARLSTPTETLRQTTISYDEKPGIQAISLIAPDLAPKVGKSPSWSREFEYKRLGTLSFLAGLDLYSGRIIGLVRDRHRSLEFIEFLQKLDAEYPPDWKIRIILDNHSAHTSKQTMAWLKGRPNRFEFIFTPKHGSWLNLVETFFSKMTRAFLRGIRVKTKQELEERIHKYLAEVNEEPVVFRWKYKLDEITV